MVKRGRPPKPAAERRTADIKIPLSEAEKEIIQSAADKPVTWAREVLLRAAKRSTKDV